MPTGVKHSHAYKAFFKLYIKVMHNPTHYTGFHTDNIELASDLTQWLRYNGIYDSCTQRVTVLHKNTITVITELKPFISIQDLQSHINAIDEAIHLKSGA